MSKLIYCDYCKDIIHVRGQTMVYCTCGKSSGRYLADDNHMEIVGDRCVPIGVCRHSLLNAASFYLFGSCPSIQERDQGWLVDVFVYKPDDTMVVKRK